eukprot:359194-Chlamydomonas_euryale.AAC.9
MAWEAKWMERNEGATWLTRGSGEGACVGAERCRSGEGACVGAVKERLRSVCRSGEGACVGAVKERV